MAEMHKIGELPGGFEAYNTFDKVGLSDESQFRTWWALSAVLCSTVVSSMLEGALCSAGLQNVYMPGSILRRNAKRFLARFDRVMEELKGAFGDIASSVEGIKGVEDLILENGGLKVYANSEDASYVTDKIIQLREEASQGAAGLAR